MTDLRAAALEHRGTDREPELRALLVELLAARAELPAAVREARAAARDLPRRGVAASRRWRSRGLAAGRRRGGAAGRLRRDRARRADLIAAAPAADPARRAIAGRLVELGLPSPALRVVVPALAAGRPPGALVGARAQVALGRAAPARATLAGLNGPRSAALRAEAFALDGDYGRALALLDRPAVARRRGYAWPAGDWPRVAARRRRPPGAAAMAGYMARRPGAAAAPPTPRRCRLSSRSASRCPTSRARASTPPAACSRPVRRSGVWSPRRWPADRVRPRTRGPLRPGAGRL